MPAVVYEEQTVCDNCGAVVSSKVVDPATFGREAEELDPALSALDRDGTTVVDDGDLLGEEAELPVEILVRHVTTCGKCSPSP